jgi:hypothetical protein
MFVFYTKKPVRSFHSSTYGRTILQSMYCIVCGYWFLVMNGTIMYLMISSRSPVPPTSRKVFFKFLVCSSTCVLSYDNVLEKVKENVREILDFEGYYFLFI